MDCNHGFEIITIDGKEICIMCDEEVTKQSTQTVIESLQQLNDDLGWHEFSNDFTGEIQFLTGKIMELVDVLIIERRGIYE